MHEKILKITIVLLLSSKILGTYMYIFFFYLCRKNFTVYLGHLLYAQLEQENILQVGSNHFDDD